MGKPKNKKRRKKKSFTPLVEEERPKLTSQTDVEKKKEQKKSNRVSVFKDFSQAVKNGAIPEIKIENHSSNGKKKFRRKFTESNKENCCRLANLNNQRYRNREENFQLDSGDNSSSISSNRNRAFLAETINVNLNLRRNPLSSSTWNQRNNPVVSSDSPKKNQNQEENVSNLDVDSPYQQLSPHRNRVLVENLYNIISDDNENPEITKQKKTNLKKEEKWSNKENINTGLKKENIWLQLPKLYGELGVREPKEDGWEKHFNQLSRNKDKTDDKIWEEKLSSSRDNCEKFVKKSSDILKKTDDFDTQDDDDKIESEISFENNEEIDFKVQDNDIGKMREDAIEEQPSTSRVCVDFDAEKPSTSRGYYEMCVTHSSENTDDSDTKDDNDKIKKGRSSQNNCFFQNDENKNSNDTEESSENSEETDDNKPNKAKSRKGKQLISRKHYFKSSKKLSENKEDVGFKVQKISASKQPSTSGCYYGNSYSSEESDDFDSQNNNNNNKKDKRFQQNSVEEYSENSEKNYDNKHKKGKNLISRKHYYKSSKKLSEKNENKIRGDNKKSLKSLDYCENFDKESTETDDYNIDKTKTLRNGNKNTIENSSGNEENKDSHSIRKRKLCWKSPKPNESFDDEKHILKYFLGDLIFSDEAEEEDKSRKVQEITIKPKTDTKISIEDIKPFVIKKSKPPTKKKNAKQNPVCSKPVQKKPEEKKEEIVEPKVEEKPKVEERPKIEIRHLPDRPLPRNHRKRRRREAPSIFKEEDVKWILWFLLILFSVIVNQLLY